MTYDEYISGLENQIGEEQERISDQRSGSQKSALIGVCIGLGLFNLAALGIVFAVHVFYAVILVLLGVIGIDAFMFYMLFSGKRSIVSVHEEGISGQMGEKDYFMLKKDQMLFCREMSAQEVINFERQYNSPNSRNGESLVSSEIKRFYLGLFFRNIRNSSQQDAYVVAFNNRNCFEQALDSCSEFMEKIAESRKPTVRLWTDKEGGQINAIFKGFSGTGILLEREDGGVILFDPQLLSWPDQEWVRNNRSI